MLSLGQDGPVTVFPRPDSSVSILERTVFLWDFIRLTWNHQLNFGVMDVVCRPPAGEPAFLQNPQKNSGVAMHCKTKYSKNLTALGMPLNSSHVL